MSDEKKLPKRRFKQFLNTPSWEQRKLGEVIERFEYGLNASAIDYDGVHKYIRITDIDDVSHKFLDSNLTTPKINFQNADTEMYKLKEGDILFARTGASVGKTYLYNLNDGDLYFAGFLIRGHVTSSNNANFVYQNTLTDNYDLFIKITSQRSGQPGVNSKEYAEFKLYIPSKAEQDKISTVLTDLDNLITLHQRKLNKLEKLKKAYLEELFPTGNQRKPKRRFKEFKDDWEQRKLGEITEIITKGTTPIDKSGQGEISFIKVENIDPFNCEIKSCAKITKKEHEGYLRRSQLKSDDILFSIAGTLGRIGVVTEDILPANTNQALAIIRLSSGDVKYITKVLGSKVVEEYIRKNPTVGAQPNLSLEQVSNLIIPYPSDEEQIKLGDFFKALDNLITLHQHK